MYQQGSNSIKIQYSFIEKKRKQNLINLRNRREDIFQNSRKLFEHTQKNIQDQIQQQDSLSQMISTQTPIQQQSFMIDEASQLIKKNSSQFLSQELLGNKHKPRKTRKKNNQKYNFYIRNLFQTPDWMNQIPEDIQQFYGVARPSGKTVLIHISSENSAKVFDKFGKKIACFTVVGKNYKDTILQGFYIEKKQRQSPQIYISDMLCWKGNIYTAQTFQFRYSWLQSNILNLCHAFTNVQVKLLQYLPITLKNLEIIYTNDFGYHKQGLYFIHRGSYFLHQTNPNALIWKDFNTSKYPIDQNSDQFIYAVGYQRKDGRLLTLDNYIVNNSIEFPIIQNYKGMVRFKVRNLKIQITELNDKVLFEGLEVVRMKKYHESKPDPLSRIIFQHRMRKDPLTIQDICKMVIQNC